MTRSLTSSWKLGGIPVPNRVLLAPLAGIGNWFVRLQAKRYGAGMAFSEMVSSFAVHYRNERTCREMLTIDPDERAGGPVAMQLFGHDPEIMRSAAARVADTGADLIDLNMGCPVPKVCKTGAGAALLGDPDRAVALARAAGAGSGLPVTVKLRPGREPGDRDGVELAKRLVDEAGVAGLTFHPRHANQQHRGRPDYDLAQELVDEPAPTPVIVSGGLHQAGGTRDAFDHTRAAAIMLARRQQRRPRPRSRPPAGFSSGRAGQEKPGTHAEGHHPHPRRPRQTPGRARVPSDGEAPRGRRTHQGGARVRRHLGELRVRR